MDSKHGILSRNLQGYLEEAGVVPHLSGSHHLLLLIGYNFLLDYLAMPFVFLD